MIPCKCDVQSHASVSLINSKNVVYANNTEKNSFKGCDFHTNQSLNYHTNFIILVLVVYNHLLTNLEKNDENMFFITSYYLQT